MEPQQIPTNPEILTPDALEDWLGVGEEWVTKNTQARRIPGQFKAGRSWRYRKADIEKQILKTGQALLPKAQR
jgi:hypothetical protein